VVNWGMTGGPLMRKGQPKGVSQADWLLADLVEARSLIEMHLREVSGRSFLGWMTRGIDADQSCPFGGCDSALWGWFRRSTANAYWWAKTTA